MEKFIIALILVTVFVFFPLLLGKGKKPDEGSNGGVDVPLVGGDGDDSKK